MDKSLAYTILATFLLIAGMIGMVVFASSKQADMYNANNNTNYSTSDFFWASEQINSQTQTININK